MMNLQVCNALKGTDRKTFSTPSGKVNRNCKKNAGTGKKGANIPEQKGQK
jgi:hypothetical protein